MLEARTGFEPFYTAMQAVFTLIKSMIYLLTALFVA